jgi:hypothetical protein
MCLLPERLGSVREDAKREPLWSQAEVRRRWSVRRSVTTRGHGLQRSGPRVIFEQWCWRCEAMIRKGLSGEKNFNKESCEACAGMRRWKCHDSRHVKTLGAKWSSIKFVSTEPWEVTKMPLWFFVQGKKVVASIVKHNCYGTIKGTRQ